MQRPSLQRQRTQAKRRLESYCYQSRKTLSSESLKELITVDDEEKTQRAVQDALDWLAENDHWADQDQLEAKERELAAVVQPMMIRVTKADAFYFKCGEWADAVYSVLGPGRAGGG
jgi:hypothetical protein